MGYATLGPAISGAEALALARATRPLLALTDIRIKGDLDGIGVAEILRTEFDIPVVFLTAHSEADTVARAQSAEPFGYLLKPFDEQLLSITIGMAIYRHGRNRAQRHVTPSHLYNLGDAKSLHGQLSICCKCHRIQDSEGHWARLERYLAARAPVTFSHGFCPLCVIAYFRESGIPVPEEALAEEAAGRFDP